MIEIKRVDDMVRLLTYGNSDNWKPKKMIFELSECGTYYNTRFYVDVKEVNKTYEGYIECKTNIPNTCGYINSFTFLTDNDEDKTMFTITIPEENDDDYF